VGKHKHKRSAGAEAIIKKAARKYGVPPDILWGVFGQESSYGANPSTSSAGAQGPFQFIPSTAQQYGVNVNSLKSSAKGAAHLLHDAGLTRSGKGVDEALGAYYGAVDRGYISGVLDKAKTWPGAHISDGDGNGPDKSARSALSYKPGREPKFDEAGYRAAQAKAIVAQLIQKHNPDSVLISTPGLLDPTEPNREDFVTPGKPGKLEVKKSKGPQGFPGMKGGKQEQATGDAIDPGKWGGSGPAARSFLAATGLAGKVSNTKNPRGLTPSGNVSDHDSEDPEAAHAYAADISADSEKEGDKILKKVQKYYGLDSSFGRGQWSNATVEYHGKKFRLQVGWQVPDHYDHVHVGWKLV